ncbi:MAG: YebG family protein [Thermodesulfobacteriota bacterium]|nr:YebG family protein [Thermodesulfobacteriota bacterium]
MAVIVKYIVVRNGDEKMTFATKKEADNHDKMLDIADNLHDFLNTAELKLNEKQMEDVALYLAENAGKVMPILRGVKPQTKETAPETAEKKTAEKKTAEKKTAVKKTGTKKSGEKKTADNPKSAKKAAINN